MLAFEGRFRHSHGLIAKQRRALEAIFADPASKSIS
jgi:hypothetical protein